MAQQGIDAIAIAPASQPPAGFAAAASVRGLDATTCCDDSPFLLYADWRRELRRTIVASVLPRLASAPAEEPRIRAGIAVAAAAIEDFADAALVSDLPALLAAVEAVRAGGVSLDSVFLDLLAPAARHLGDLWLADRLSFLDVTAGLGRLQAVVRALGPNFEGRGRPGRGRRILLAPVEGEQHVFGLSIVAAFFRRAGWAVTVEPAGAEAQVIEQVRHGRFDAVGLSAAGDAAVARLSGEIAAIRRAAGPSGVAILVGGPAFLADPGAALHCGADAVACDATEAVRIAATLDHRRVEAA